MHRLFQTLFFTAVEGIGNDLCAKAEELGAARTEEIQKEAEEAPFYVKLQSDGFLFQLSSPFLPVAD